MKKKGYLPGYFLINSNQSYEHSFAVRLKYVGLNVALAGWAFAQLYFNVFRLKGAEDEKFD